MIIFGFIFLEKRLNAATTSLAIQEERISLSTSFNAWQLGDTSSLGVTFNTWQIGTTSRTYQQFLEVVSSSVSALTVEKPFDIISTNLP
tara:strand:- start:385 stop:651 length:267 start_codon:yes stop_codon:yes gene_type:complete